MNDLSENGAQSSGELIEVASTAVSTALDIATGLPEPIREGLLQATKRLTLAAVELPAAWLEGKAAEIRAGADARVATIQAASKQIAAKVEVPEAYVLAAQEKALIRIVGKQKNLDAIVDVAASDLLKMPHSAPPIAIPASASHSRNGERLNEDWLNSFEEEAANMSTPDMQMLFGKILAGEINRPGSFSRRTLKLMSELDNVAAKLFLDLCSMAVAFVGPNEVFDIRVPSLNNDASNNGLADFGLSFPKLNILQEYGLIIADLNSWIPLSAVVVREDKYIAALRYLDQHYALVHRESADVGASLRMHGVRLSVAGQELFHIVQPVENKGYGKALFSFLSGIGFDFVSVPNPLNPGAK